METVDINEFKKEERRRKWKERWEKAKALPGKAVNKAAAFYNENKEFCVMVGVPVAVGCGKLIMKALSRSKHDKDEDYKERSVWDARSGQWFTTRKPMSNFQKKEFARRKSEGEDTYEILEDMRLI